MQPLLWNWSWPLWPVMYGMPKGQNESVMVWYYIVAACNEVKVMWNDTVIMKIKAVAM